MSKRSNPMFKKTAPFEPEILPQEPEPFDETFPGGLSVSPPLSKRERSRLEELEVVVTRNFKAFYEVGCALREICNSKLYRETHDRFDEYVKDLWDLARRRAYQYIEAADVMDNIKKAIPQLQENVQNFSQTDALLPINDSQARALAKYPEQKQIEIWQKAISTAKDGKITASHVRATADAMSRQKVKRKTSTTRRDITRTPRVSDDFRAAFQAFLDQINVERASGWKNTDASEIARHLRGLLQAVEAPL
jgi:hypothetical protein